MRNNFAPQVSVCVFEVLYCLCLTLDDGQQDDNDKEEEGDVKDHPGELIVVSCWVPDLISYATASSHAYIHVE